ncbi:hypothetical protein QYE76_009886 [Lolium multiflorum]|uniref:Uncharacterized protein n=1 Tax=Lolium multiflorum TaxID=4521 RepID=A0AAD8TW57_LOLMU|nr:hypothetical protein QYE76_009886 [Lolium multiflorum]
MAHRRPRLAQTKIFQRRPLRAPCARRLLLLLLRPHAVRVYLHEIIVTGTLVVLFLAALFVLIVVLLVVHPVLFLVSSTPPSSSAPRHRIRADLAPVKGRRPDGSLALLVRRGVEVVGVEAVRQRIQCGDKLGVTHPGVPEGPSL